MEGRAKRYAVAAIVGLALFALLAWWSYGQRGYFAVGGEAVMLLMPFWYAFYRGIAKGEF